MKNRLCGPVLLLVLSLLVGCDPDNPSSIYNPNDKGNPAPEISQVIPVDSTLAGIGEITIVGRNFSPVKEENFVFVGKNKAAITSSSETEIKIQSPVTPAKSLPLKVAVHESFLFSNIIYYTLIQVFWEWGDFGDYDDAYGIEMDNEENLYVFLQPKRVDKVTAQGERIANWGSTGFPKASHMKMGPGGYLYLARIATTMYRIPPAGGEAEKWATAPGKIYDFDFAEGGIMYAGGGNDDLYRLKPDGTGIAIAPYPATYIRTIRVFNGYVYVGGEDNATKRHYVWRHKIVSADELGPREDYFDFTSNYDPIKAINSITFAADGDMYIGTDADVAIVIVHPDGSHQPLYPGVVHAESYAMTWGNSTYLYIARRNEDAALRRIIKLNMLKEGAPYYGRM